MASSAFDLFKIGTGPSSSQPMRAAFLFAQHLSQASLLDRVKSLKIELFGSLGATGKFYRSDKTIMLGLEGESRLAPTRTGNKRKPLAVDPPSMASSANPHVRPVITSER